MIKTNKSRAISHQPLRQTSAEVAPQKTDAETAAVAPLAKKGPPGSDQTSQFGGAGQLASADLTLLSSKGRPQVGASPLGVRLGKATIPGEEVLRPLAFTDREIAAYHKHNDKLVEKNPNLAFVLKDPDAFVEDMKNRFSAQKAKTPDTPYAFDVSDIAAGTLSGMDSELTAEIEKVEGLIKKLEAGESKWIPDWVSGHSNDLAEHKAGLAYLKDLKAEVGEHLDAGNISYRRMQEIGFFTARALGMFDMDDIGLKDRTLLKIDRYLQGYQDLSPTQERARYEANDFSVFQKDSPVGGFEKAHRSFEEAFFHPDEMKMVAIPSNEHLGPGPFMRLVSRDIYILGISREPSTADGFVRPGGDFWLHDLRHASAIFQKREEYEAEHNLSAPQIAKLEKKVDVWKDELNIARSKIEDKQLRYAIGFFMFNLHHDRGYPMIPSSYTKEEVFNHVPKLLYAMLKISGQKVGFEKPLETMTEAYAWLQDFWGPRLAEEQAVLNAA